MHGQRKSMSRPWKMGTEQREVRPVAERAKNAAPWSRARWSTGRALASMESRGAGCARGNFRPRQAEKKRRPWVDPTGTAIGAGTGRDVQGKGRAKEKPGKSWARHGRNLEESARVQGEELVLGSAWRELHEQRGIGEPRPWR